jgi:N-acetylglucosaminyldiphosphoundecaprenol N-acetyl-beta-D-mannosaminyltransferase
MDYLVGETALPPRWAGPLGLYGLVRLVNDPARLWKRYLIEPWFVLALLLRDLWHLRREAQRALPPGSVDEKQEAQGS